MTDPNAMAPLSDADLPLQGRCYCGGTSIEATTRPLTVSYCHCDDCRRATGAPVAALASFSSSDVSWRGAVASAKGTPNGVTRSFCHDCGSPIAFEGDYVPDQKFIHLALFEHAARLVPSMHSYDGCRYPWLAISDEAQRFQTSSRAALNAASAEER